MRTLSIVSLLALASCLKGDVSMGTETNPSTTEPTMGETNVGATTYTDTSTDSSSSITTGMTMTSSSTDVSTTSSGPMCGDGVPEGDEECDDGNLIGDDGCSPTCTNECGDGKTQPSEECDAGSKNDDAGACTSQCRTAKCGDGLVHVGVEACDGGELDMSGDPTPTNTADCDSDCTEPKCGDLITNVPAGEQCDDGQGGDARDQCGDDCRERRLVFVARTTMTGADLNGLDGADALCQTLAEAARQLATDPAPNLVPDAKDRKFRAWLSAGDEYPAKRMQAAQRPKFAGDYVRFDGAVVAAGWEALTDGGIEVAIDRGIDAGKMSSQVMIGSNSNVVTNTDQAGKTRTNAQMQPTNPCTGWTMDAGEQVARRGKVGSIDGGKWTDNDDTSSACSDIVQLYCFEDKM